MTLIAFANQKGGVGKSTLAVHTTVWLFDQGLKVALLDADVQGSSSQWLAEAEPGIPIRKAHTPDDCLAAAQELLADHEIVVADGPGGLDEISRTLLLLADLAVFPISPSILDLRSVSQATTVLRYAQGINRGRPDGRLVLNKIRARDTISRELREAAPNLGVGVARIAIRDLQSFRDAAQQGSVASRMKRKGQEAAKDIDDLCRELLGKFVDALREENWGKGKEVVHG